MLLPEFLWIEEDGEIQFKGHRIRLLEVAKQFNQGHSAEAIALDIYPTLQLAEVYKAIAFYLENQPELDALIAEEEKELDRQAMAPASSPSLNDLRRRVASQRRAEAS